jgi:hypothetical protein
MNVLKARILAHADEINWTPKKLQTIGAIPCGIDISRVQKESSVFTEALRDHTYC